MRIRHTFLFLSLWSLLINPCFAQIIADFTFDDTSDMPASLKKNAAGPDAHSINPNARSDGEGVYTLPDPASPNGYHPDINLEIPEELLNHTESIYLEFDYRSQEDFAWLIFSGHAPGLNLFRFAHSNYLNQPEQQGFHVRYLTKADPENVISSGFVGEPMQRGERALIGFLYDKETGTAYIFKNGQEIWQTPDELKTPGYALHWQTANGYLTVGSNMNGDGSITPSLYRFRAFEEFCAEVFPPLVEGSACEGEAVTFTASGGEEGQYRWYATDEEVITLLENEKNSSFTTPTAYQSETYYVSIASEDCESPMVPVVANLYPQSAIQHIEVETPCGPGEATISWEPNQEDLEYHIFSVSGVSFVQEEPFLTVPLKQDTLIYLSASNGICESERVAVQINLKALPTLDAGQNRTILKGESVDLSASGVYESLQWDPHESLQFADSPTPKVKPGETQTYRVRAVNKEGCEVVDSVTIFVRNHFPVPNAFSPNQDGINDYWEIPNIENYPNCKVMVFNRWGNELFSSEGYKEPWDGTHNGTTLPFGTYYYTLQLNEEKDKIKGTLLIIP